MLNHMNETPIRSKYLGRVMVGVALSSGLLLYACTDDTQAPADMAKPAGDMSVAVPHNFEQINTLVLAPSCAGFSVCHSSSGQALANKLNLCSAPDRAGLSTKICGDSGTLEAAWRALYNQPAQNMMAKNEGLVLVKPCDPDNSFLVKKLELPESQIDPKVGYGGHMPTQSTPIPAPQRQAIRDWISRGAHLDEPADVTGTTCVLPMPDAAMPDSGNSDGG